MPCVGESDCMLPAHSVMMQLQILSDYPDMWHQTLTSEQLL